MKSQRTEHSIFVKDGGELLLSGPLLSELLCAVFQRGMPFRFQANGFSMSPFIKDGDVVVVFPLTNASPGLGDVLAFIDKETENIIIHRAVGKKGDCYLMKGDNSSQADGLIPEEDILGYVKCIERNGKKTFVGLGPERLLIAFINGRRPFFHLIRPLKRLVSPVFRRLST